MFDETFAHLEKGLKTSAAKQSVIAHNIANAKTPGYEPMDFDAELNKAVKRQDNKKVLIEEEMAALSDNSIRYSAMSKLMVSKLNVWRNVVSQGRK
ncbi:MAG: flagellar basal body protein [Candidatus Margulisiibacteriota bacterium]